jgi:hypothetical protein
MPKVNPTPTLTDLERAKTILVLLEMHKKHHPEDMEFSFRSEAMLLPLRDQFEMERAFLILDKETQGNVQAKYQISEVYSEGSQKIIGSNTRVFIRIKSDDQFYQDCRKIYAKKESAADNKIFCIEINEPIDGKALKVFINNNYINEINPAKRAASWAALLTIAQEGEARCASTDQAEDIVDFFNTQEKGRLYSKSGYDKTKILVNEEERLFPLIPIKLISEKAVQQRLNKHQLKKA